MDTSPQLLKSGSDTFKSKLRNLFDTLAEFEKDVNLPTETPKEQETTSPKWKHQARKNKRTTRAMKGQESLFKVPGLPPISTRHNVPDFRRNPSRWTKYTLADVPADDMTETSNTAAAMSFLNSRKCITDDKDLSKQGKVQFKKVIKKSKTEDQKRLEENSGYKDSKRVMPEYVVGQKIVKPKRTAQKQNITGKELNLSHLHDIEDDDEF